MKRALLVMGNQILPSEVAELEKHFDVIQLWKERDPEAVIRERASDIVAIASVYYVPVSKTLIEALPNLEIIAQFAVGTDNIDLEAARNRGIAVTNTPDVLTNDTADIALSLLLAVSRRICESDMFVRVDKWRHNHTPPLGRTLSGKTAGIVGMGRIGQAIAKRCEAFGLKIIYNGPRKKENIPYGFQADLKVMAEESDYLILACPGGAATRHLVHAPILEALGPNGFLINISRGSVVHEEDLVNALTEKKIAGAGLDVYAAEPHVPAPLVKMDNVVLLPHVGSATVETRAIMGGLVVSNLLAHFRGDPLLTPVQ
ncbi:MAG TPA: 2-hydroxyacid dehydrogenase [Micavibrio sp.]|nr:2-hydroxyacid dehydrogenase [Micavibrio sp.]